MGDMIETGADTPSGAPFPNGEPNLHDERAFSSQMLAALLRFKGGDFTSHLPGDLAGIDGKIADVFNEVLEVSARRATEISRVCRVVGKEGKLKQRMNVPGAVGGWADEVVALNTLIDD